MATHRQQVMRRNQQGLHVAEENEMHPVLHELTQTLHSHPLPPVMI